MLRKIRIVLAALCFILITLMFVGIGHDWWGFLAKLQALPTTLRVIAGATLGNVAVLLGIVLVTLLLGRIYCSVICPLGVFQDLVLWIRRTLGKWFKPLRKRFKFNKERRWVRYPVAALLIGFLIGGLQLVVALLEPYSGRKTLVKRSADTYCEPTAKVAVIGALGLTIKDTAQQQERCRAVFEFKTSEENYLIFSHIIEINFTDSLVAGPSFISCHIYNFK